MSYLSLSQAPTEPARREPKSPLRAFVLSLVLPGAGHLYCGKRSTGLYTLGFFLACVLGLVWSAAAGGGDADSMVVTALFLRPVIALYVFSFVDAFETAREGNRGADLLPAGNPRIAAVLNFLTRGFGYFYLAERKKGMIVFVLFLVFGSGLRDSPGGEVIVEAILLAIAADAYRLCQKLYPPEKSAEQDGDHPGALRGVVYGLAATVAVGYFALVVVGLFTSG